ncbi:hypothetical protein AAX05_08755 [Moraxella bovoculi]|uniref:hypothetical protein n=1 Tax=Moraxella bovoculi TaxID=386891 RepID=UPI0006248791|nr:hypothetical protein [Moraxella bovoculi]AKG10217.1 hypothetical protein AAX05_08755 [Moraxella bovoculi]AKG14108.1 hypothetical protein AAX11_08845 [Moraxella bovoculi]
MINTIIGTVLSNTGDEQFMAKIQEFEFYPDKAMAEESAYAVYLRKYPEEVNPRKNAKVSPWYAVIEIGNIDLGQPLTKNIFYSLVWADEQPKVFDADVSLIWQKKRPRF